MYNGMRATNKWASLYFVALMAVGYYVLFNLLVAILVEGFTGSGVRLTSIISNTTGNNRILNYERKVCKQTI